MDVEDLRNSNVDLNSHQKKKSLNIFGGLSREIADYGEKYLDREGLTARFPMRSASERESWGSAVADFWSKMQAKTSSSVTNWNVSFEGNLEMDLKRWDCNGVWGHGF